MIIVPREHPQYDAFCHVALLDRRRLRERGVRGWWYRLCEAWWVFRGKLNALRVEDRDTP